ncbi:CdaR family transcriptional regulator [Prauserella coralliicola]|nr:CdaR family transcriptional regulator [Prauserella coralliicola]
MADELQRLVENLGNRLKRSVAVDDPQLRLLAYSPHVGEVDPARTGSILRRSVSRALIEYCYECGAGTATDLFTLPARPELGMDIARIGMPVYHQQSLLGFVWLLASDGPVTEEHAEAVRQEAETVRLIIHRQYLLGELTRGRERELTRDLLTGEPDVCTRAAEQLVVENLFSARPAAALVVALTRADEPLTDQDHLALAAGVEFGRTRSTLHQALTLERPDHAILLFADSDPDAREPSAKIGHAVRERVLAETGSGVECWVGLGAPRKRLADVHASYTDARRAAEVARVVRVLGPVVHYSELGVYGLLAELPVERLTDSLHPGLRRLLEREKAGDDALVLTLETFLGNAGDVKRTSDQLHIHRTSLYYRLKRIQEITGLDLSGGDDRLTLQLGIKIARLVEVR